MHARIEIEASEAAIDMLTDEFEPVEEKSTTEVVLEEEMADVIEVVQLQGIPTEAWTVEPGKELDL